MVDFICAMHSLLHAVTCHYWLVLQGQFDLTCPRRAWYDITVISNSLLCDLWGSHNPRALASIRTSMRTWEEIAKLNMTGLCAFVQHEYACVGSHYSWVLCWMCRFPLYFSFQLLCIVRLMSMPYLWLTIVQDNAVYYIITHYSHDILHTTDLLQRS